MISPLDVPVIVWDWRCAEYELSVSEGARPMPPLNRSVASLNGLSMRASTGFNNLTLSSRATPRTLLSLKGLFVVKLLDSVELELELELELEIAGVGGRPADVRRASSTATCCCGSSSNCALSGRAGGVGGLESPSLVS